MSDKNSGEIVDLKGASTNKTVVVSRFVRNRKPSKKILAAICLIIFIAASLSGYLLLRQKTTQKSSTTNLTDAQIIEAANKKIVEDQANKYIDPTILKAQKYEQDKKAIAEAISDKDKFSAYSYAAIDADALKKPEAKEYAIKALEIASKDTKLAEYNKTLITILKKISNS